MPIPVSKGFESLDKAKDFIRGHKEELGNDYSQNIGRLDTAWGYLKDAMTGKNYLRVHWDGTQLTKVEVVNPTTAEVVRTYD